MGFSIGDDTASVQRFAVDNSGNTEVGNAIPSEPITISGVPTFDGTNLAQSSVLPQGLPRITGTVFVPSTTFTATVSCPVVAGFGVTSTNTSGITSFTSDLENFNVYADSSSGETIEYAVC